MLSSDIRFKHPPSSYPFQYPIGVPKKDIDMCSQFEQRLSLPLTLKYPLVTILFYGRFSVVILIFGHRNNVVLVGSVLDTHKSIVEAVYCLNSNSNSNLHLN